MEPSTGKFWECPEDSIIEDYIANEYKTLCSRFKMKRLNNENEVGSTVKSTIKYTLVPQGGSIGKGREQGLKYFTMSACHGIKSIGKNFMLIKKEYMKNNTPYPTSTNQVKKYTQEFETSAIKKGLEQRPRSLNSSLGISEKKVKSFNKITLDAN
ncbi:hypothetical protein FXO38_23240 [Capsicum annuum]|nr:hypothetical protein FXO38_23240 [Capsicum annuum]KAF3662793.1 hypothetical protein FXO37_12303 [Capsicum annuum]